MLRFFRAVVRCVMRGRIRSDFGVLFRTCRAFWRNGSEKRKLLGVVPRSSEKHIPTLRTVSFGKSCDRGIFSCEESFFLISKGGMGAILKKITTKFRLLLPQKSMPKPKTAIESRSNNQ